MTGVGCISLLGMGICDIVVSSGPFGPNRAEKRCPRRRLIVLLGLVKLLLLSRRGILNGVEYHHHTWQSASNMSSSSTDPSLVIPSDASQTLTRVRRISSNGPTTSPSSALPKLPVPKLEDSCRRYLRALEGLQDEEEHERTRVVVKEFLTSGEGERWQRRLEEYSKGVDSYIEEFWCESSER
jgi:hypothetical protein